MHAHPDDETISTGGTIASLLDRGAAVTLVTCTRGELGEVVPAELQHLAGDALGEYRETELATAMDALGLTDYRFLGSEAAHAFDVAPHRYRDSGMQWGLNGPEPLAAPTAEPHGEVSESLDANAGQATVSLTDASLDAVIADLCAVIDDVEPTAVVSYDSGGGYGHPDHVRTHDAASSAALIMDVPFYTIVPVGQEAAEDIYVDVREVMERKKTALRAYSTQLTVDGNVIVHSGGQVEQIQHEEVFRRAVFADESALEWSRLRPFTKAVACLLAFLVGGLIGVIGTVNHQIAIGVISLLLVAGFLAGLRLLFGVRAVAACAAVGMLIVLIAASGESLGGSVLIQANEVGFLWTYGVPVIALIVLAWPRAVRPARVTMEKLADPEKVVDAS